jgi:hypothetical protein
MLAETNQINAMPAQIQAQTRALNASADRTNILAPQEAAEMAARAGFTTAQMDALRNGQLEIRSVPGVGIYVFDKNALREGRNPMIPLNVPGGAPMGGGGTQIPASPPALTTATGTSPQRQAWHPVTDINDPTIPAGWKPPGMESLAFPTPENTRTITSMQDRGAQILSDAQQKAQTAYNQKYQLASMKEQAANLPQEGLLTQGPLAPRAKDFAMTINQFSRAMGGGDLFDPNQIASMENIQKDSVRLGAAFSATMGHEPGFIVNQAIGANPGINNTALGFKRVTSALEQALQYQTDRAAFMQSYYSKFQHLDGAEQLFSQLNPPQAYAERAIFNTVSPEALKSVETYKQALLDGKGENLRKQIDEKYGQGVTGLILKNLSGG